MSCPNCGSWAVKADRSMGGRMICGRCGQPLGAQIIPLRRSSRRARRPGWPLRLTRRLWWWLLGLLVGISGVLAAMESPRAPWRSPTQDTWGQRQSRSWRPLPGPAAPGVDRGRRNTAQVS